MFDTDRGTKVSDAKRFARVAITYMGTATMNNAIFIGILPVAIWLYLMAGRGGFWTVNRPIPAKVSAGKSVKIVAVVPARNEADVIGRCVRSLLSQVGVDLRVIVVDDASSDGTADRAREAAIQGSSSDRLEVIAGKALPSGWSGKLWAVQQGLEHATRLAPDYFLLTDADIEHDPDNVRKLAIRAEAESPDLASLMVKLHCSSVTEKLLIPAFVFFFFKLYPPKWIADSSSRIAGAAGGCMLVRASALGKAGGIEAIRGEIIDDCALAMRIKQSGGKVRLSLTDSARSIRPYDSFAEIGRMISRTAFNQLRHSTLLLMIALIGLVLTYVLPLALPFSPNHFAKLLGAIAIVLMSVCYLPMVRFYRLNPLWVLTLPLAAIFYMGATLLSAVNYWSGRGGRWKGRVQDSTNPGAGRG